MRRYPLTLLPFRSQAAGDALQALEKKIPVPGLHPKSTAELLELVSFIMDRLVEIPGTRFRVGINTLLMLVPFAGDALASLISVGILTIGLTHYRVPRIVATRMMLNTLLDATVGSIPVVGTMFDMFFKADTRNVALLQEHLSESGQPRSSWRHWVFVVGLLSAFALVLALVAAAVTGLVLLLVNNYQNA